MPDCKACKENRRANAEFSMVGVMAAANRRTFIALIVSIILLFLSNAIWLYAWMQYDYVSETETESYVYTQDGNGYNNINTGRQGDVTNGAELLPDENNNTQNP